MEKGAKRRKQDETEGKGDWKKRSPLQDFNGRPIGKPFIRKSSNPASSSASVSMEAPKCCFRMLLSSNSCSSSSASSSSVTSGAHPGKKPRTLPKIAADRRKKSTAADASDVFHRSKENDAPQKRNLQKSKRNQRQCVTMRQCGKSNARPVSENGQKSTLSSFHSNSLNILKKGSEDPLGKTKTSLEDCAGQPAKAKVFSLKSVTDNSTSVGRVGGMCNLDSMNLCDHRSAVNNKVNETASGNSADDVKTPPVEASLSPEIQRQSNSKLLVLKSAATPVCYGAGHLVSGVTDNRKCRRRGSLRGGCEKSILFDDERTEEQVVRGLRDSLIPLPAEASVRWLLSPCDEGHEDQGGDLTIMLGERGMARGKELGTLDLSCSPSLLSGNSLDLLCSGSTGTVACPKKAAKLNGVLEPLNTVGESSLVTSPCASYSGNVIGSDEGKTSAPHFNGNNSVLSIGSLSSGNIIQTPNSNSSSDACAYGLRSEMRFSNFVSSELDSIAEALSRVDLSPRTETPKWDASGLGATLASNQNSEDFTKFHKNVDSVSSWMSDSMSDYTILSQMKISWQDGLVDRNVQADEFDCCCLSDEEINAEKSCGKGIETCQGSNCDQQPYLGAKAAESKEIDSELNMDLSPILSEYEPSVSARGKEKLPSQVPPVVCAESICSNGGGLVASGDSDWTYCHEDQLFHVR